MPVVAARCTQCGAELQVDNKQEAAICEYCGTPFIVEKAINNFHITQNFAGANVTIVGQDFNAIKTRASMFLEEGNFDKAMEYVDKALDIKVDDAELYCMRLLAKNSVKNIDELKNVHVRIKEDIDFERVLKWGDSELVRKLTSISNYVDNICDIDSLNKDKNILSNRRETFYSDLETVKRKYRGSKLLKVLCYIISIPFFLLGLLLCITALPLGLSFVLIAVVIFVFGSNYDKKATNEKTAIKNGIDLVEKQLKLIEDTISSKK